MPGAVITAELASRVWHYYVLAVACGTGTPDLTLCRETDRFCRREENRLFGYEDTENYLLFVSSPQKCPRYYHLQTLCKHLS
jgi:hypothetical protein